VCDLISHAGCASPVNLGMSILQHRGEAFDVFSYLFQREHATILQGDVFLKIILI
jgi:hypothetical protein